MAEIRTETNSEANALDYKIKITALSIFLDEYSNPKKHKYLFCYKVRIANESDKWVKLLNRHWIIIDSNSKIEEVKGPGVLGQQPELVPGDVHEYYSFCNLETNFGTMEGFYEFIDENEEQFLSPIPRFYLAETLNQFDRPIFKRGQIVKHKHDDYRGIITDYDMYFINDEEIYNKNSQKPAKDKPWYYILIDGTNAISYTAEENLVLDQNQKNIEHSLVDFFFNGFDGTKFIRNDKTWDDIKRA